jgi:hypothetical protein
MQKIDRVEIKTYDQNWSSAFTIEALLIRQALGGITALRPTSVPGLYG